MAHLITSKDKFGFTGDRSKIWHGLGDQIPEGMSARDAFPLLGLDWETELAPVYAEFNGQKIKLPENRAHVRRDTGDVLGLVSDGYKPIDNGDLAGFADDLLGVKSGASVSTAGSLLGGRRVFCLLQLPETIKVVKGDLVDTYLCISNGHGGFASFNCYPTSIRPVCANTLSWSEKDLGRGVRFHHTGTIEDKLKQARTVMGFALKEAEMFGEKVRALANTDLSKGQIKLFMEQAFIATFGNPPDKDTEEDAFEKWTARRVEMMEEWAERLEGENQTIKGIQGTAWAALNAYTEWSDHDRGGKWMEGRTADSRVHSNLFGASAKAKRKVLKAALAFTS